MEISVGMCLAAFLPILLLLYKLATNGAYKFPAGPKGWPILGNIFDVVVGKEHIDFTRLAEQNGDVMCLNMAGKKMVVLSSVDAIREAFVSKENREAFAGRPESFLERYCDTGPSASFSDYGDVWRTHRKFLTKVFKLYDNDQIQVIICEQLSVAVKMIEAKNGQPFELKPILGPSLVSIFLILIAGKRLDVDDPALKTAIDFLDFDFGKAFGVLSLFPFLRHLPFGYRKLYMEYTRRKNLYFHYFFETNKNTFDPSISRGFIDELFLLQHENNPWPKDDHIKGILREIMAAGAGTTESSLLFMFLILLHKPEVMRNIQDEIDALIGRDRFPKLSDRSRMSYTEAVLLEVHRYVSVVPVLLCHSTTRDVKFREYFLPKKTMVYGNVWAVHHDSAVWGDPWEFRPERFLDEDGNLVSVDSKIRKSWMPFGVGRRSCLAERFGRSTLFLFITRILKHFDIRPCADEPLPSLDPRGYRSLIVLLPPRFKLHATRRSP